MVTPIALARWREDGSFVDSHKCFSILLRWLLERKKWPGDVVRAFNTTKMLDRIAAKYGRKLHETSIGFKYIADIMMEREVLIGGEESGGIGFGSFLPERDGVLNSLLLANVMADEGKPLGQLVADLQREFGLITRTARYAHPRRSQTTCDSQGCGTRQTGKYNVQRKETKDGVKYFLDAPQPDRGAEAWILFRASGTEPLLRLYAEAATTELRRGTASGWGKFCSSELNQPGRFCVLQYIEPWGMTWGRTSWPNQR